MSLIGASIPRHEDEDLLRGRGRFVADIAISGTLDAAFVRSRYPHAAIRGIETIFARRLPGVIAVLTLDDLRPILTKPRLPLGFRTAGLPDGITSYVLADGEVAFVGDAIAMVIAENRYIAEDAAALVEIDYEPLPAVADARAALHPGAPTVRRELASNLLIAFTLAYGDTERAFAAPAFHCRLDITQHRGGAHPIEGRGILAEWNERDRRLTAWSSTQMPHELQFTLAEMLGLDENDIEVTLPDVGGGFGCKFVLYPEEIAIPAAALLLRRPIRWMEDRGEHFVAAIQERDQYWTAELALDAEARILGVRGSLIHDQGAYTPQGINLPYNAATAVTGPYLVPAYRMDVQVAQTNKVPVIPVRGAGYPEAAFVMERLLDHAARELKLDRAEIRRRNLIPADRMPYEKPLKVRSGAAIRYDSGDYPACQAEVLAAIDWSGFPARQAAARAEGRHIGIGLSHAIKGTGRGPFETGVVRISPTGRITIQTGAAPMGQGICTALAQICAGELGVLPESIKVTAGSTRSISMGLGGFASRQLVNAGSSVLLASRIVADKARRYAAHVLEAAEADLELRDGRVQVTGVPGLSVPFSEIATALRGVPGYSIPATIEPGLEAEINFRIDALAYANACHAVEVEVDIDTGGVKILRYVALQDCGTLVNPLIVKGQVQGGIIHGIGNALYEWMGYDAEAQPVTVTFADYLLPAACEMPNIEMLFRQSPSPLNPLGAKGVGEVGTIAVAPALASAIEDAIGVRITAVPILPGTIVRATSPMSSTAHCHLPPPCSSNGSAPTPGG